MLCTYSVHHHNSIARFCTTFHLHTFAPTCSSVPVTPTSRRCPFKSKHLLIACLPIVSLWAGANQELDRQTTPSLNQSSADESRATRVFWEGLAAVVAMATSCPAYRREQCYKKIRNKLSTFYYVICNVPMRCYITITVREQTRRCSSLLGMALWGGRKWADSLLKGTVNLKLTELSPIYTILSHN